MTIKEFIEKLQEIEDQNKEIFVWRSECGGCCEYLDADPELYIEDDGKIIVQ